MYVITDLKPGTAITLDGEPFLVMTSQFGRKSQSKANMQCKLKNLKTGAIVARNFQGSEKIEPADVGYRHVQYLYAGKGTRTFMDLENYDQFELTDDVVGEGTQYLTDGLEVDALLETIPGVKGDTATGGGKPAKLSSGVTVNVPLFISEGEKIKVNTESGEYVERANN
jgi:elongation factor P